MRNFIVLALALLFGAAVANAHDHKHGKFGCARAKMFLKHNGAGIDALLDKEATGHMKTLQDVAKIKVDLLEKAIELDPPIPFLCHKALKKVKKIVKMVAVGQALIEASANNTPAEAAPAPVEDKAKKEVKIEIIAP
jgi:hypothetical protein